MHSDVLLLHEHFPLQLQPVLPLDVFVNVLGLVDDYNVVGPARGDAFAFNIKQVVPYLLLVVVYEFRKPHRRLMLGIISL